MEGKPSLSGARREMRKEGKTSQSVGREPRMEGKPSLSGARRDVRVEGKASQSTGRRRARAERTLLVLSLSRAVIRGRRGMPMKSSSSSEASEGWLRSAKNRLQAPRAVGSKVSLGTRGPRSASVRVGGRCGRAESCGRRGGSVSRRPRPVRGRGIGHPGPAVPGWSLSTNCNNGARGAGRRWAARPLVRVLEEVVYISTSSRKKRM